MCMNASEILDELEAVGQERSEAIAARRAASERLAFLIPRALLAGASVSEIARRVSISRMAVHNVLKAAPVSADSQRQCPVCKRRVAGLTCSGAGAGEHRISVTVPHAGRD